MHPDQERAAAALNAAEDQNDVAIDQALDRGAEQDALLKFFKFSHLPERLKKFSRPFADLACAIIQTTPRNAERTVALRKLLEAKDAGVRAAL